MIKRSLAAAVCALAAACGQTAEKAPEGPAVQLYAMDCGRAAFANIGMFGSNGEYEGQARTLVDPCYLIRHPNGDMIWDTGFPDAVHDMPNGLDLAALGAHVTMPAKLVDQLAQIDVAPADIDYLSLSHSHGDHTGNSTIFTDAMWLVDADERTWMFREDVRLGPEFASYALLEGRPTQLIEGDADYDVFGDGSVVIIQAPGHTPGHAVLLVRLRNAGAVILSGDLYHLAEARERRTIPRFNTDPAQTLASMDRVERIAAENNAQVIRQHVQEDFDTLPRFPAALN